MENQSDRIARYIDDAISMEGASLAGLKDMVSEATDEQLRALLRLHIGETERQKSMLEARLQALGHTHSGMKEIMNRLLMGASDLLHAGKDPLEKQARNLIQAYTVETFESAMYESLAAAAEEAGDNDTAALAREIQAEEEATAQKIFPLIEPASRAAVSSKTPDFSSLQTAPADPIAEDIGTTGGAEFVDVSPEQGRMGAMTFSENDLREMTGERESGTKMNDGTGRDYGEAAVNMGIGGVTSRTGIGSQGSDLDDSIDDGGDPIASEVDDNFDSSQHAQTPNDRRS